LVLNTLKSDDLFQRINSFFKISLQEKVSKEDILNKSIIEIKEISPNIAQILQENFHIFKIKDLLKLEIDDIDRISNELNIDRFEFERYVIIAKLISQIDNKHNKNIKKINLFGLDNAGKTAIRNRFFNKYEKNYIEFLKALNLLKPTKGIEREKFDINYCDIQLWDLGGQKKYRTQYLNQPHRVFVGTNVVIYVIDVQSNRFGENLEYLKNILKIYNYLSEEPYIIICFHKMDPNIKDNREINLKLEKMKNEIKFLIKEENFNFKFYITSIFDDMTIFNLFSHAILQIANKDVKFVINNILREQAEKIGTNNILLMDSSCLKLGYWAENDEICNDLYNYLINFLSNLNIEIFYYGRFQNIDSIDINLDRQKILTIIKRFLNNKLVFFASIHKNTEKFYIKNDDILIPWIANLIT